MPKLFIQEHRIPLFSSLTDEDLDFLVEQLEPEQHDAGSVVIREGDPGDCLYLIKKGSVKVVARLQDTGEELILSRLEEGDYFGEMALLTGEPRSASVIAESDTSVWKLSKEDFENLIRKHPDITLTLTHMLSHRLKNANEARQQVEEYYKQRFIPHGKLQDTNVITLLKYIEDNSLTGELNLTHNHEDARFFFKKGQLMDLSYQDKDETEAMDEILAWSEGGFIIKPELFRVSPDPPEDTSGESSVTEKSEAENETGTENEIVSADAEPEEKSGAEWSDADLFRSYLADKIEEFNRFAGLQVTKNALRQSYHKFENYFDVIADILIESSPEVQVEIKSDQWTEKHTLFAAILLRDLVTTIERDVIGIEFWSPGSGNEEIDLQLNRLSFFEYYEQATDFIRT